MRVTIVATLALAAACGQPSSRGDHALTDPVPELPNASLIAVAPGNSIRIGAQSEVHVDTALGGGELTAATHCALTGDYLIAGGVDLGARTVIDGDLTLGGDLELKPGAAVTGTVTHAAPPAIDVPSVDELLQRLSDTNFGNAAPDIVVERHQRMTLSAGGRRVDAVRLAEGATLIVDAGVDLEARLVSLASRAEIVVQDGGRLRVHLLGRLEMASRAAIVQRGQDASTGLSILVAPAATLSLQPNVEFGPGLLYAPEATISLGDADLPAEGISTFRGAIVAQHVWTRGQAVLDLSARFLRCPFDVTPPKVTIAEPASKQERELPPGTTSVTVSGAVTDDVGVESAILTDSAGSQALQVAADGSFTATASLRADGEPTQICVSARDCGGRATESCVLVAIRHDLSISITAPRPGAVLGLDHINITGRIGGGPAQSIDADGVLGVFLEDAFIIKGVALSPGTNVITLTATSPGGDVTRRRLVVSLGPLQAEELSLSVDDRRVVTMADRQTVTPLNRPPPDDGHLWYRLLDAGGVELHRGRIPGTAPQFWHYVDGSDVTHAPDLKSPGYRTTVIIPDLPVAAEIEFLDEGGLRVGRAAL